MSQAREKAKAVVMSGLHLRMPGPAPREPCRCTSELRHRVERKLGRLSTTPILPDQSSPWVFNPCTFSY